MVTIIVCSHCTMDVAYKDGLCLECWILDTQIAFALTDYERALSASEHCGCRACVMSQQRTKDLLEDLTQTWVLLGHREV